MLIKNCADKSQNLLPLFVICSLRGIVRQVYDFAEHYWMHLAFDWVMQRSKLKSPPKQLKGIGSLLRI